MGEVAVVVAVRPGAVTLSASPLRAAGGGQAADLGWLVTDDQRRIAITDVRDDAEGRWHLVDADMPVGARVEVEMDAGRREQLSRLHTAAHLLNSLVFARFEGALVNGAQINGDGTARVDFDLPGADNDALRAFQNDLDRLVAEGRPVRPQRLPFEEVLGTAGMVRSLGRVPPTGDDGLVSIVEIDGFDRQACGGTHVANTADIGPVTITKIENRGRHNRRIKFRLADVQRS